MNAKHIKEAKWHKKWLINILSEEFDVEEMAQKIDYMISVAEKHRMENTPEELAYKRGFADAIEIIGD